MTEFGFFDVAAARAQADAERLRRRVATDGSELRTQVAEQRVNVVGESATRVAEAGLSDAESDVADLVEIKVDRRHVSEKQAFQSAYPALDRVQSVPGEVVHGEEGYASPPRSSSSSAETLIPRRIAMLAVGLAVLTFAAEIAIVGGVAWLLGVPL